MRTNHKAAQFPSKLSRHPLKFRFFDSEVGSNSYNRLYNLMTTREFSNLTLAPVPAPYKSLES